MPRARLARGALALALGVAACSRFGRNPVEHLRLPPGFEVLLRVDVNGDGVEDVLAADPADRGAIGTLHMLWVSGRAGFGTATFIRHEVTDSDRGTSVYCFALTASTDRSGGYRDLLCDTRVYHDLGRDRARVRYRWDGESYVSELAHMAHGTPPACVRARARRTTPVLLLPARNVAVLWGTPEAFTSVTPVVGELTPDEGVERVRDVVDAAAVTWTTISGRGWARASELECAP